MVQTLVEMSDDDFRELVDRELRNKVSNGQVEALRSPVLADRWYSILVDMKKSVEGQLGARRSDVAKLEGLDEFDGARREFHRWRAGSIRFRTGIEERIAEARRQRQQHFSAIHLTMIEQERNKALAENSRLIEAIRSHRDQTQKEFDEYTDYDKELWDLLGGT